MKTITELLVSNKNLILTGAPGTGKTYLAKQIDAQMILGKEFKEDAASEEDKTKMKEQCGFVQFHPSYDYTDFVEGLRPITNENGAVGLSAETAFSKNFVVRLMKTWSIREKICKPYKQKLRCAS